MSTTEHAGGLPGHPPIAATEMPAGMEAPGAATARPVPPGDPRYQRPDGTVEPKVTVEPAVMREFLDKIGAVTSSVRSDETGREFIIPDDVANVSEHARQPQFDGEAAQKVFNKVALYLDPKMPIPHNLFVVRHKAFICRIPTQAEALDVMDFIGNTMTQPELTQAQITRSIIGELLRVARGWVPESGPDFQILRENIMDPSRWPKLRPIAWMSTFDATVIAEEIMPLWALYNPWKDSIQPTSAELDFYYSQLR
jgi:hypothetical protein